MSELEIIKHKLEWLRGICSFDSKTATEAYLIQEIYEAVDVINEQIINLENK